VELERQRILHALEESRRLAGSAAGELDDAGRPVELRAELATYFSGAIPKACSEPLDFRSSRPAGSTVRSQSSYRPRVASTFQSTKVIAWIPRIRVYVVR
jgi:hypothetical protein